MSTQIFKNPIPTSMLFDLLEKICLKTDTYYLFNFNAYKKGVYNETIPSFLTECIPYYHLSKRVYLEKTLTHKSFTTVLRQICNYNNITYTSQIKYDKSLYEIVYYIYF